WGRCSQAGSYEFGLRLHRRKRCAADPPWRNACIHGHSLPRCHKRVVHHSSKAVDNTTTQVAVWWRWAPPDPGVGSGVEVLRGNARRLVDLLGIGEVLAGEGLAAEEAPRAFLQDEPAGPRRERDRVDARMLPQPLLDGRTGVAGEVVTDQVQVAGGIGGGERLEEVQIAGGVACGSGEGEFLP